MKTNLQGKWNLRLGEEEGTVILPGILQAQGYGNPVTKDTTWVSGLHDPFWYEREEYKYGQEEGCKVPFLSQPPRHYTGKAFYEREFAVSEKIEENLFFYAELAKWKTSVWIDGVYAGSDCSLCTPHEIMIGKLEEGIHTITVCVDNGWQYPYRPDGHGVSDALGATWNGMVGEIAILSESERIKRQREKQEYALNHPRTAEVRDGGFYVDGRLEYFRGTHFGGDFPLTGYPTTDRSWWDNMMNTVKEWGLNFIRCHSFCPPEAAFAAADEAGIYIQPECGMWNVFQEGIPMLSILKEETERILRWFGHHPSFVLFSPTNEPSGSWYHPLKQWVKETREYDESLGYKGRRLYTAQSGWFYDVPPKDVTGTDYLYFHRSAYGPILGGNIRNHEGWKGADYRSSLEGAALPVICHELGQWCAYPDFSVIDKFTGYLQPGNYIVFRENARARGLLGINEELAYCSGKTQVMMYKEDLEANLRTPHIYGFELLDLHDYLGQGTALVGVLDPFWGSKGYVTAEEFKEYCNETVFLARIASYVYKNTDRPVIPVEVCHFGRKPFDGKCITWSLTSDDGEVTGGSWNAGFIENGKNIEIGMIELNFSSITDHKKLTLVIESGRVKNHWDLYVYCEKERSKEKNAIYTRDWKKAKKALEDGERVVYSPYLTDMDYECPALSIRPVFWNAQMGPGWVRTLGLSVCKGHPLFENFPTEEYGGWQWEDILKHARGFCMDEMPEGFQPLVRVIDDWNRNLPLSLLLEAKVGRGNLLLVSASLEGSFEKRPAAASLKSAIMVYAASDSFQPKEELKAEMIERHLFPVERLNALGTEFIYEEGSAIKDAEALADSNPNRSVKIRKKEYPVSIVMTMKVTEGVRGLVYVPDQKDRMHEGGLKDCRIEVLEEGKWELAWEGSFDNSLFSQKALFHKSFQTDQIKITVLSSYETGERMEWIEGEDGWYQSGRKAEAVVQAAGFHVICSQEVPGSDYAFWSGKRRSTTKEIEE